MPVGYNPYTSLGALYRPMIQSRMQNPSGGFDFGGISGQPSLSTSPIGYPQTQGQQGQPSLGFNAGQLATGAIGFASSVYDIFNTRSTLDPLIENPSIDQDNPTINASSYLRNISQNADEEARTAGNAGILSGAASGAQLGSVLGPIGTIGGGIIGGITGLIGRGRRRRKARERREEARSEYNQYLQNYNTALQGDLARDAAIQRGLQSIYGSSGGFPRSTFNLI